MEVVVPDFGLARVPDFTTAALSGYQAGRTIGRERRTEAALKSFQTDPEAGIRAASFDPKLSGDLRNQYDDQRKRELGAKVFAPTEGRQDGLPINMQAVRDLAAVDQDMAMKVYKFAQDADAAQIKTAADHAEIKGQAATYLQSIPEGPERIAAFEALKPELIQRGFKPEDLAQARLDSESLKRDQAFGMSMKDLIDQQRIRYQPVGEGGLQPFDYLGRPVGDLIGAPIPASPQPSIPATGRAIEETALSVFPGANVTSRKRSPDRNKSVGGVDNSYHLTDQARDFTPPRGVSMDQLANGLRQSMPGFDVINEGDHVHVEPASRQAVNQLPRESLIAEARRRGLIK